MKEEIQLIKNMQKNFGGYEFDERGQRALISHMHLVLRQLVFKSQRNKIEVKDLELAMSDMNFKGFFDSSVQKNLHSDLVQCQQFEDVKEDILDIEKEIKKYVDKKIIKEKEPQPYFDWMVVDGQLQDIKQIEKEEQEPQQKIEKKIIDQLGADFKINKKGIAVNDYYLQKLNPNIITDQSNDFLRSFIQIQKNLEDQIDKDFLKIDSKKFHYCILISTFNFDKQ